jgi:RNA polymerase sigma-70 factor (ECF subfamily)
LNENSRAPDAGRAGSSAAYLRELPKLRRIAAGMGFTASDADDILQDVFLEASRRPGEFRDEAGARSWLCRVTTNRCLLEYRRRARFVRAASEIGSRRRTVGETQTHDRTHRSEEIERVRRALRELDGALAAVLVLRYFCGFDSREIGEMVELPAATVRSRLRAARKRLAEGLLKED